MPDDTSTILSLPYILPAQAQKHVTHNEALRQLDVIVQLAVTARNLAVPPAAPAQGDRYIVAAGASGDWAGKSGQIALFDAGAWQFFPPLAGWTAWIAAESALASFNGGLWVTQADAPQRFTQVGISATADTTNRLAVSSPATLLNHAGAGHQVKVNKATASDTASLLFQTGFSGRAEMGTSGNDDFAIKVSTDGSAFVTGLSIAGSNGQVTLPAALRLGGQTADPVSPTNGMIWLNTTTGEVKVRSNGNSIVIASVNGVANGQLASMAAATFKGRDAASTGAPQDLTPAQAAALLPVVSSTARGLAPASGGGSVNFLRADGTWAAPIVDGVANGQLASMAAATFKGRDAASTGTPQDLTPAQAAALLPIVSSTARGLAPASGGGSTNFLRADGTWAIPPVSGSLPALGITATAAQINPLGAAFDNAFLGAGAKGNLAGGANDFGNTAFWPATTSDSGMTCTRTTGVDAMGPFALLRFTGVATGIYMGGAFYASGASRALGVTGEFFTGSVIVERVAQVGGGVTGMIVGVNTEIAPSTNVTGALSTASNAPTPTTLSASIALSGAANQARTYLLLQVTSGATIDVTYRIRGLQFDKAASRLSYPFRALSASEARAAMGVQGAGNLLINGTGRINQRGYVSGTATTVANQFTLDRWFVVTSGQALAFSGTVAAMTMTAPVGGVAQVIEGANITGGTYCLSWVGSATATVNGAAVANGGTVTLPAGANATIRFAGGTFTQAQLELGTVPAPYQRLDISDELRMCERFYQVNPLGTFANVMSGVGGNTRVGGTFRTSFRAAPTVSNSGTGTIDTVTAQTWSATMGLSTGTIISPFASAELTA